MDSNSGLGMKTKNTTLTNKKERSRGRLARERKND